MNRTVRNSNRFRYLLAVASLAAVMLPALLPAAPPAGKASGSRTSAPPATPADARSVTIGSSGGASAVAAGTYLSLSSPEGQVAREKAGFDPADSAGLFIGVNQFDDEELTDLQFAVDDAIDLAKTLVDLGLLTPRRVRFALSGQPLKPATSKALTELIAAGATREEASKSRVLKLLEQVAAESGARGILFVQACSHGFDVDEQGYIALKESVRSELEDTGLKVATVQRKLRGPEGNPTRAVRRLLFVDACRNKAVRPPGAARAISSNVSSQSFIDAFKSSRGQASLLAADVGRFSYESEGNGLFTRSVISGLRGAAPAGPDGVLTLAELSDYVGRAVMEGSRAYGDQYQVTKPDIPSDAASIPLAIDPKATAAARTAAARRTRLLGVLRTHAGEGAITGAMLDEIAPLVRIDGEKSLPDDKLEALLRRLENLEKLGASYTDDFADWWTAKGRPVYIAAAAATPGSTEDETPPDPAQKASTYYSLLLEEKPTEPAASPVDPQSTRIYESLSLKKQADAPAATPVPREGLDPHGTDIYESLKIKRTQAPPAEPTPEPTLSGRHDKLDALKLPERSPNPESTSLYESLKLDPIKAKDSVKVEDLEIEPSSNVRKELEALKFPYRTGYHRTIDLAPGVQITLVYVEGGTFVMGSPTTDNERYANEGPLTKVTLSPFWMAETETTVAQFRAFVEATRYRTMSERTADSWGYDGKDSSTTAPNACWRVVYYKQEPNHPVTYIAWEDAKAFADWLAEKSGLPITLPTEAQFEYCLRADQLAAGAEYWAFPWGDDPAAGAASGNHGDAELTKLWSGTRKFEWSDGFRFTAPVKSYKPNAFKLYDIAGNLREWTLNFETEKLPGGEVKDPVGPPTGRRHMLRGDSWSDTPTMARSAFRDAVLVAPSVDYVGFRVAAPAQPSN